MRRKIEEINNGLHNVEKMLQQKSKNIEKAQEIQKVKSSFNSLQHLVFLTHSCPVHQLSQGEFFELI